MAYHVLPLRIIACFIKWKDGYAEFKRLYLMCVLLSGASVFTLFTQWHNPISGGISDMEDVIDRILLFVTGIDRDP